MEIWLAEYTSTHFTFRAVGKTEKLALRALLVGLRRHGESHGLAPDWYGEGEDFDANTYQMRDGMCRRDDTEV